METKDYLHMLVHQIHTAVVATIDELGLPMTCAIDLMDHDANSVYFLTAQGKSFYMRLKQHPYVSLTGIRGDTTLQSAALTLHGKVREVDASHQRQLFAKNLYMYDIYPSEASRQAIRVFQLYEGCGERLDLSRRPIERASFSFGTSPKADSGYFVTAACDGCGRCAEVCPQDAIRKERSV